MKFKILLLIFYINLCQGEILSPGEAVLRFDEYGQINNYPLNPKADYELINKIQPNIKCYDVKGKYKFKEYSLEDFICQSSYNSFGDNYFSDLYNLIIKENPNLKEEAQKIARQRIKETKKECMIYTKDEYEFVDNDSGLVADLIGHSVFCILSYYQHYTAKLALMLYKNDQELFERIYDEDYEYFKEVFEDTLKYVPILHSEVGLSGIKKTDDKPYAEFLRKYDDYAADIYRDHHIHDLLYIVLVQYSLIDEKGHLVLPEDRKEEEE